MKKETKMEILKTQASNYFKASKKEKEHILLQRKFTYSTCLGRYLKNSIPIISNHSIPILNNKALVLSILLSTVLTTTTAIVTILLTSLIINPLKKAV
jgi:hypothetical protein